MNNKRYQVGLALPVGLIAYLVTFCVFNTNKLFWGKAR
jgi:hypothetical protein